MKTAIWALFYLLLILFFLNLTIPNYMKITDIHRFKDWFTLIMRTLCIVVFSIKLLHLFQEKSY